MRRACCRRTLAFGLTGMISMAVLTVITGVICFRLAIGIFRLWRSGYEGSPTVAALRMLLEDILTPGRIANGFHAILATGIFAIGFTTLKTNIPRINPFSWDEAFMRLDQVLHGGVLPHELLAPLFQHPPVSFVVNLTYNFWFLIGRAAPTRIRRCGSASCWPISPAGRWAPGCSARSSRRPAPAITAISSREMTPMPG